MSFSEDRQGRDAQRDDVPRELRAALDDWDVPAADAGFRADLRARFLAGGVQVDEQQVVSELNSWDPPAAREEFRSELRERFLSSAAAPAQPARGKLLDFKRVAMTLAAVAALVLLYVNFTRPAAETWRIVDFAEGASFELDGERVSEQAQAHLNHAFVGGGCAVSLGEEHLAIVHLREGVMLEFPAETEMRLIPAPRGESGLVEIDLIRGGLRVSTTEEFMGRVLVHTPEATIALTGDSIGVDVVPEGTCLCIVGGSAEMQRRGAEGGESFQVGDMSTAFMNRDGEVTRPPTGQVHHHQQLDEFNEFRDKYMY